MGGRSEEGRLNLSLRVRYGTQPRPERKESERELVITPLGEKEGGGEGGDAKKRGRGGASVEPGGLARVGQVPK